MQEKTLRNDNYFSRGQLTLDLDAIFSVNHTANSTDSETQSNNADITALS